MSYTVLSGGYSDAFFERGVERGIGVESNRECNVQDCGALAVEVFEQTPGVFNTITVQVIKKTCAETGIDHLRQVVDRATHVLRQFRQGQFGFQVYLLGSHHLIEA